jgi:hypothetical protein
MSRRKLIDSELGDHMPWGEFLEHCERRLFIDYDGMAERADETHRLGGEWIYPSQVLAKEVKDPPTHIIWYNK